MSETAHRPADGGVASAAMRRATLLLSLPFLLAGCSGLGTVSGAGTEAIVRVSAADSICWTANIDNASQEGCGTKEFPVTDPTGLFSSNVQKKDDGPGTVTISVVQDGKELASNSTSAAYGVAQVVVQ